MQDLAKLNDMAQYAIDDLRADGIEPTPAEIVELSALGWGVESPETRRLLARGVPVEIAGVWLWPMSLYAQEWFDRVGCKLAGNAAVFALAYAMAHGRDDGEPLKIEGRTAEKIVTKWGKSLKCTFGELNVAVARVLRQDETAEIPQKEGGGGITIGDFSAFLASALGGDPDFWERRCAAGYAHAVLDTMVRQNMAEGRACSSDPRLRANMAFGMAVEKIKERHKDGK
jgi:hypothetical protein